MAEINRRDLMVGTAATMAAAAFPDSDIEWIAPPVSVPQWHVGLNQRATYRWIESCQH